MRGCGASCSSSFDDFQGNHQNGFEAEYFSQGKNSCTLQRRCAEAQDPFRREE
eukprot:IDg6187t1